ncbi:MAG: translocation/assembly module TamB domain-containing protein [Terracidiphilus sp.]
MQPTTSAPDPHEPRPPRSLRRPLLIATRFIAVFIVFPILLGAVVFAILVNTSRGHAYLINLIQKQAETSLGVPVRLQNLDLHLFSLSADLYGLTIDGASQHPNPPLLQVQHAEAAVRVVSVFRHQWYFDNIRIDNPVAQIYVDKNGVSNLPTFKSSNNSSNTTVFDLAIRHAVLANGAVFYNNQPSSLALDLSNVQFNAKFNSVLQKYSGTLAYSDGRFNYAGTQAPTHAVSLQFEATPTTFHLSRAQIQSGNTNLVLNATINNYSAPVVQAQYNATVDGQQLAGILHDPTIPAGLVSVSGNAKYHSMPGRTLLQSLTVQGDLTSRELVTRTSSLHAKISNIAAHYSLANGDATLRDFRATLLGGEVTAQGTMKNIGGDSRSKFDTALHGISLGSVKRMMGSAASTGPVEIAGTLNATATATWGKTFNDLRAHTDATIHADMVRAQYSTLAATQAPQSQASRVPSLESPIPIESALHATYTRESQQLALDHSYFHTPQTNLSLNGTVSKNSSLAVQLQANDLREIESIADLFRTPVPGQPMQALGLAGTASFNGIVRGSTSAPHLAGQLTAQNLQLKGSSWKLVRTNIDASPSNLSLQHAELDPAGQGRLTLNASTQLQKWSFSKSSPVLLQINASQLDISELAKLAGQQIPATGTLAANIQMHGSVFSPEGTGSLTLTNAAAYGEPISSLKANFSGSGDAAHANLYLSAPAGSIEAKLATSLNNKTYSAELTSTGIHLDKLQRLKTSNISPAGVVSIDAKGQGTFDNPQLDAAIQIPRLVVQQQTISNIRLQANVANHQATAQLTSSAVNTAIKANAKIALTGDYPADATLDTQGIPLGPLIAAYAPDQAASITGQTELHATLHGPLKDKRLLEAHVTIPVLKLAYSNTVQLAAVAPIHVDYKDGTISVQRSSIHGTDTDLQFQGTIPTAGNAPMSLLLLGSVDLHLAQLFNPDLRTSGQLKLNVNSYGAANVRDIAGTIDVVDAAFSAPDLPVGLQHCNGTLSITKDRINITQLKGNMGGGTLTAQGGVALRPSVQFDLGLAARNIRMLYPQGLRESIDGNIRLTGSPQAALLGGNVNIADLSLTPAFDLSSFIDQLTGGVEAPPSQGFTQNLALNLAVHSSNNVNLVSRTLSVGGSANLQVRGTVAEPVILGRANLTGGDIILHGNRFVLTGGTIQFVNPSMTQPVVNLTVTTSIQQYNISLRFDGPVDQLRTQYTSDPSLPSADIIHLLAFGQTTEASAANATPANQAAETLVANQVSSQVTSRISKAAGISQLSINPVLAGSNAQGPAGATITVQQRVTGNLFVTFSTNVQTTQGETIQGQYQVTPRVAVSATRDPNGGFALDTLIKKTW